MNERVIRNAFHRTILKSSHTCADTFVIDELGLKNGESRADIAVLNGKLIGYEIKTEKDNLNRLLFQVDSYNGVFDKVYIVTGKKHLDKVMEMVPEWWGIYVILGTNDEEVEFKQLRRALINKQKDCFSIAQLLWKNEAFDLLTKSNIKSKKSTTKHDLYDLLALNYKPKPLGKVVLQYLKSREHWRTNQISLL